MAAQGFPDTKLLAKAGKAALGAIAQSQAQTTDGRCQKLQGVAYETFVRELYPNCMGRLVARRINNMFPNCSFSDRVDLDRAFKSLAQQSKSCAMMVLKTWLNGWATSTRYHEPVIHSCLWGCPGGLPDATAHYISCPRLWKSIQAAIKEIVPNDPLDRLALVNATDANLRNLCVAYHAYHTFKLEYLDEVLDCRARSDTPRLAALSKRVVRASAGFVQVAS